ncbi:MAG: porin family protein [Bacteroidota bacterium]
MKKQLFLFLACFGLALGLTAQIESTFGLRAGLGLSTYTANAEGISVSFGNSTKLFARAFYINPIGPGSSLQIEGGYSGRGFEIGFGSIFGGSSGSSSLNFDVLELGLLYRYDINSLAPAHVYFLAGPVVGHAINGVRKESGVSSDVDFDAEELNRTDVSLEIGTGLAFGPGGRISVEARLGFSLSALNKEMPDDEGTTLKHRVIQLGLGYSF